MNHSCFSGPRITAPSELLSGKWTYVRALMDGSPPCNTEGGFDGEIKATADVAICCANNCGKTNLPVSSAPVGKWCVLLSFS